MMPSRRLRSVLMLLVLVAAAAVMPGPAEAGCLAEYDDCQRCAKASLLDAMKSRSPLGVLRANIELWDCAIDLNHCVFFGSHHSYPCAR